MRANTGALSEPVKCGRAQRLHDLEKESAAVTGNIGNHEYIKTWTTKMSRTEFSKTVRLAAWNRCGGHCEKCTAKITAANGPPQYDHIVPDAVGGPATLDNCQTLCKTCHNTKTHEADVPQIAKTKRVMVNRVNAVERRSGFRKPPAGFKYDWKRGGLKKEAQDDPD